MKTAIAIIFLATTQLFADCPDPLDPACVCTNCPWTNTYVYEVPAYLLQGHLQMRIDQSQLHVTNTIANHVYQLNQSSNALDWSLLGSQWTNAVGPEKSFSYSSTNREQFYRVRDVYFQTVYGTVQRVTNSYPCFGSYEGYATYYYYEEGEHWGNIVNTNTYWQFFGNGNSNEHIVVLGRWGDGDQYCGSNSITFHAIDSHYRFSLYFKSNAPPAGTLYPIQLGGFMEQD